MSLDVDWEGMDTVAPEEPNPFDPDRHPEEYAAWEKQTAAAREQVEAARERQRELIEREREERKARYLADETEREYVRIQARRLAEQRLNDEQHQAADDAPASSWAPLDLTDILDGSYVPEEPRLMPRCDGVCLLYPGRVHTFQGESESGKSMVAQAETARVLAAGGRVGYIDFESDASVVVGRILMMGATREQVATGLLYLRPGVRPHATLEDRAAFDQLLADRLDLAVIDGVTEAASVFGVASKDNDEITAWNRLFARPLAQQTGAAVIQVDHVTKDSESRGRFAIGAQAKMSALDGAAYVVEVKEPLGRGLRGVVVLRVAKDRPGAIRPNCGAFRKSDRTQEAAQVVVDSTTDGVIAVTLEAPSSDADARSDEFRPTSVMERVSQFLEAQPTDQSENQVMKGVGGRDSVKKAAINALVTEGFVARFVGPRNAQMHHLNARYRQSEDPKSDKYEAREGVRPGWAEVEPPPDWPE
ncbi:hypothetical protein GAR05_06127 [Micromonospora saelicesensis]|uniref:AAA domain-containing protein n=1 Tax=Micromonospora saelicesensis TaxID=285676 RepID=A0ABX9CAC6_9ACTN|nr:AAA family ATPase [Micromonospora saelicesensis]RAN92635.1 hypothetical protein GAR05_06127 [Micromonospora saelicesensis]